VGGALELVSRGVLAVGTPTTEAEAPLLGDRKRGAKRACALAINSPADGIAGGDGSVLDEVTRATNLGLAGSGVNYLQPRRSNERHHLPATDMGCSDVALLSVARDSLCDARRVAPVPACCDIFPWADVAETADKCLIGSVRRRSRAAGRGSALCDVAAPPTWWPSSGFLLGDAPITDFAALWGWWPSRGRGVCRDAVAGMIPASLS
jgi:hypothetical protein